MNKIHLSPSIGQQCGIASFASTINEYMDGFSLSNTVGNCTPDVIVLEHEYGIHGQINYNNIAKTKAKKVVIQHAYSPIEKYKCINEHHIKHFDHIIFLTNTAKNMASSEYTQYFHKFHTIPHYAEELKSDPKDIGGTSPIRIGMHGFAFPRNGFMRLLNNPNLDSNKHRVFIMASISEFNATARFETSVYLDKIRRKIWQLHEKAGKEFIKLDFHHYSTKDEISETLRNNSDVLFHVQDGDNEYVNASGSIQVLLATGIPVFTIESIRTETIPKSTLNRVKNVNEFLTNDNLRMTSTKDGIIEYHTKNTPEQFAKRLMEIINGN